MKTFEEELSLMIHTNNPIEVQRFIQNAKLGKGFPRGLLASKKVDLNQLLITDETFVMQAIHYGNPRSITGLILEGASPLMANSKGDNALTLAATIDETTYIEELLTADNNKFARDMITFKDKHGKTAFDIAIECKNFETARCIYHAGVINNLNVTASFQGMPVTGFEDQVDESQGRHKVLVVSSDDIPKNPNVVRAIQGIYNQAIENLVDNLAQKYSLGNVTIDGLQTVKDSLTDQNVLTPKMLSTGNITYMINNPKDNQEVFKTLLDSTPEKLWEIHDTGSLDCLKDAIKGFGVENVRLDDTNARIARFKEELREEYPDIKFKTEIGLIRDKATGIMYRAH